MYRSTLPFLFYQLHTKTGSHAKLTLVHTLTDSSETPPVSVPDFLQLWNCKFCNFFLSTQVSFQMQRHEKADSACFSHVNLRNLRIALPSSAKDERALCFCMWWCSEPDTKQRCLNASNQKPFP